MPEHAVSTSATVTRLDIFGPPPLLEGEDTTAYDELLARVSTAVKPIDILEDIWVRDIVDLVWEILRLRRIKTGLFAAATQRGLEEVLRGLVNYSDAPDLASGWALNDQEAREEVQRLLDQAGLTMDAVTAQTLALKIDHFERIDRMIAGAEARRNGALREIERHRENVAERLRRASEIADAEFEEVITAPTQLEATMR